MNVSTPRNYLHSCIVHKVFIKKELLELNELTQQKFEWGMNLKTLSLNKDFLLAFVAMFDEHFAELEAVQVCGMESGALPFLAAVRLHSLKCTNAFYIRKSAKKSDLAKTVEGTILKSVPIIIIDDLINNGGTVKKQLAVLESLGFSSQTCFTLLRFRDTEEYLPILGEAFKVRSVFALEDFSRELGINNLKKIPAPLPDFYAWKGEWKISLSNHNPYIVVPKSGPVSSGTCVYMGSDDGYMRAVEETSGQVLWQTPILFGEGGKRIFSTPAISGEKLFFGAYDGNFYCLDRLTGKRLWVFMDAEWIGSSPVVSQDGKTVYIGLEFGLFKKNGGIAAIDVETGSQRWGFYAMEGLTHASPAVSAKLGVVVCGNNDHYVYCFNSKDGTLLWKFKTEGEVKYSAVFDERKGLAIIASMDGKVYCLDTGTGKLFCTFNARAGFYSTPALYQNKIIIGSMDKTIYCFDLDTKETAWSVLTRGRIFSSPAILNDQVFIGSNDGCVYEVDIASGKTISVVQLPDRVVNRVIIKEKEARQLYVSTDACDLYKFTEVK